MAQWEKRRLVSIWAWVTHDAGIFVSSLWYIYMYISTYVAKELYIDICKNYNNTFASLNTFQIIYLQKLLCIWVMNVSTMSL